MPKSVLGDDPFAASRDTTDRTSSREDQRNKGKGKGKPSATKKGPVKTPKKRPATAAKRSERAAKRPPPPPEQATEPRGRPAPHAQPPRPPMSDGASARRASRSTSVLGPAPQPAETGWTHGAGLDPEREGRSPPTGSLTDEFRRIEQRVTRRLKGDLAARQKGRRSLLDRVGALLDPTTYARWISTVRMSNRSDVVDDFGLDPVCSERWRPILDFLYHSYWRVETIGMENLPDHGSALIVANHSGTLPYDGAMIMHAVRFGHPAHRLVRPLVEDFVFHFPFVGVALNRIGGVRACQENAERLLSSGQVIVVFPEGIQGIGKRYSKRYKLQRFGRGGFIKLALKTQAPVIPAAVVGAEEIYPMLAKFTWLAKYLGIPYIPVTPTFPWLGPLGLMPLPSKWTIRFGEPLDLAAQHGANAHHDRILVNRLTEQVRSTIQSMIDETLLARRSVVFG